MGQAGHAATLVFVVVAAVSLAKESLLFLSHPDDMMETKHTHINSVALSLKRYNSFYFYLSHFSLHLFSFLYQRMTDQPQAMRDSAHLEAAAAPTTPTTPAKSSGFLPSVPRKIFWLWIALGIILVAAVVGTVLGVVLSKTNSIKPVQLQDHPIDSDDPTISIENIGDFHALSQFANLTAMKVIRDDPRFETNNKSRVFVVGDVHGSLPELNALVEKLEYDYDAGDRLILAGDLVDKGPDSIGVIRRAKQLKAWCVRGNHDDKVVRLATYHRQGAGFGGTGDANIPEGAVHDPLANDNHHIAIAR